MDPPYDKELEKQVLDICKDAPFVNKDTLFVIEASLDTSFDYLEEMGFELIKDKRYKTNRHVFVQLR